MFASFARYFERMTILRNFKGFEGNLGGFYASATPSAIELPRSSGNTEAERKLTNFGSRRRTWPNAVAQAVGILKCIRDGRSSRAHAEICGKDIGLLLVRTKQTKMTETPGSPT